MLVTSSVFTFAAAAVVCVFAFIFKFVFGRAAVAAPSVPLGLAASTCLPAAGTRTCFCAEWLVT